MAVSDRFLCLSVFAILLAVAGCGDKNEDDGVPPAPPVTASLEMDWTHRAVFGGTVDDMVRSGDLYVTQLGTMWRYDLVQERWFIEATKGEKGHQFVTTSDGHVLTNKGYRLTPGMDSWENLDFQGVLAVSVDGRSVIKRRADRRMIELSQDNGETWMSLPAPPHEVRAFAFADNIVFAAISISDIGLWRLDLSTGEWLDVGFGKYLREIMPAPDGSLYAVGVGADAYWSADGLEWETLDFPGVIHSGADIVGRDLDGAPLIALDHRVYRRASTGDMDLILEHPPSRYITAVLPHDDGSGYLVGGAAGLWELSSESGDDAGRQFGLPGNYTTDVFHLSTGTFASVTTSVPWTLWAKWDVDGSWKTQFTGSSVVQDAFELPNGDVLLATTTAFEGGYGDLFRWNPEGTLDWLLQAWPEMESVTVDDHGRWFVSTAFGLERKGYRVYMSDDEGVSWRDTGLSSSAPRKLLNHCSRLHAIGSDGMAVFETDWHGVSKRHYTTVAMRGDRLAVSTSGRLWMRGGCGADLKEISMPQGTIFTSLAISNDGSIWATSLWGQGLHRSGEDGVWRWFGEELAGDLIGVSIDNDNRVWVRIEDSGLWLGQTR